MQLDIYFVSTEKVQSLVKTVFNLLPDHIAISILENPGARKK